MPAKNRQKATSKQTPLLMYLVVAGLILLVIAALAGQGVFNSSSPTTSNAQPATTTFHASSVMGGFTIEVPVGFEVEEEPPILKLTKSGVSNISIIKSTTNFPNLSDYIYDLDKRNIKEVVSQQKLLIDNNEAVKRKIKLSNNEELNINYVIYTDGFIYTMSTNVKSLEEDIDQIAQTFQVPEK